MRTRLKEIEVDLEEKLFVDEVDKELNIDNVLQRKKDNLDKEDTGSTLDNNMLDKIEMEEKDSAKGNVKKRKWTQWTQEQKNILCSLFTNHIKAGKPPKKWMWGNIEEEFGSIKK